MRRITDLTTVLQRTRLSVLALVVTAFVVTPAAALNAPVAAAPVGVAPSRAVDSSAPVILNAPASARAGDVIGLQGENFGAAAQVWLDGASGSRQLDIINRVGTNWIASRVPADAGGALVVRVVTNGLTSAPVKLNAAVAYHLDAMTLSPGGAFKIFGRNLLVSNSRPSVTVNGLPATLQLEQSDEHRLVAIAPVGITRSDSAVIVVDNGNGSGPATLDRVIDVRTEGNGEPAGLGVGWASAFTTYWNKTAAADMRCNGRQDDSPALQAAVDNAASKGGGVVIVPVGICRLVAGIVLKSNVIVSGAGKGLTTLRYESSYPISASHIDLSGVKDLTLLNNGSVSEGPTIKNSTRIFLQRVTINMGKSRQLFFSGNKNFVVSNCDFNQVDGIDENGPYTVYGGSGIYFNENVTRWAQGTSSFTATHDAYFVNNRFIREGKAQYSSGVVHAFTIDFAHRVAVIGNSFEVANGPIINKARNDGETISTEGGGKNRTENIGTATSATALTLTDTSNVINVDPFGTGSIVENYGIAIVGGKGAGQSRRVVSYSDATITVDKPWLIIPDNTSRYATAVWGFEKALIRANSMSHNPRGIWLYHTAIRDVDVVDNKISEGGGIYLRSFQNLSTKSFMPIWNVRIARNKIINTTNNWLSYINATFVNPNADTFGIGILGLEVRDNEVITNKPNQTSTLEETANLEGLVNMMRIESYKRYRPSPVPPLLGTVFQRNACHHCEKAFRVGTGAGGTVIIDNKLIDSVNILDDWATTNDGSKSIGTILK